MTETRVESKHLSLQIPHLKELSEQGWLLSWGDSKESTFQLLCQGMNLSDVARLEAHMSAAYEKALPFFQTP